MERTDRQRGGKRQNNCCNLVYTQTVNIYYPIVFLSLNNVWCEALHVRQYSVSYTKLFIAHLPGHEGCDRARWF